jgi:hypothetical protein
VADGEEDLPALQDPADGDAWALVMEWKKSNIPNELTRRLTTRAEEDLSARRRRDVLLAVLVVLPLFKNMRFYWAFWAFLKEWRYGFTRRTCRRPAPESRRPHRRTTAPSSGSGQRSALLMNQCQKAQ